MMGLTAAVDRIAAAIERKEPILIYGDYDVDGTMAVIILKTAIELCGGTADFHVPHRIREGYDMRDDVIERAAAAGVRLIVSVDMGIRAFAPAETAQRLGVDLIVTDHHLPGPDGVPNALAVVNPNQKGCEYPYKQLCGAGVAFKVAQGLMQRRLDASQQNKLLMSFMKIVAIATIADAVPLTGENRVFAALGTGRAAQGRESRAEGVAGSRTDFCQASADFGRSRFSHRAAHQRRRPHGCGSRCDRTFQREGSRPAPASWQPNSTISIPTVRKKSGKSCARWKIVSPAIPLCAMPIALLWMAKAGIAASSASPRRAS
jgi:hypothetical protein